MTPSPAAALTLFEPATGAWFASAFPAPTPVQAAAWRAIGAGEHTLVIAPTGSGKTLAAFLHAIDQLYRARQQESVEQGGTPKAALRRTRVLYLSPIKA